MEDNKKLLSMLGLAKKSGRIIVGTPMIIEHIQKKQNIRSDEFLVLEASNTSPNTHKKLSDKCNFYNIRHIQINATCDELGAALGKSATAAVAIIGSDMCRGIEAKIN